MTRTSPFAFALVVLASGCGGYEIHDDVDYDFDLFDLLHSDQLHPPYAPGAVVRLWAERWGNAPNDPSTWTWESSDPSVVSIETVDGEGAALMVAPGTAVVTLRGGAGGEIRGQAVIEVGTPVEAELLWHGELLLDHPDEDARVDDARVLVGEEGAFLVRFRDTFGRLLNGAGGLGVESGPLLESSTERTFLFERRDWLVVMPLAIGPHEVRISAGGIPVDAFLVTGAGADEVANVVIEGQSEAGREAGDRLVMVAHAEDAEGRSIFGIDYTWDVDGEAALGFGDVLRYDFDPRFPVMVGASFAGERAETMVHAGGGFVVSDSARVGCSAGRASSTSFLPVASALVLLAARGRRLRRGAPRTSV